MKFDGKAFGEEFAAFTKAFVQGELAPLRARLDAAERRVAELEALPKAATAAEIAALIPAPKDGESVDPATIKAMVDDAVAAIPPAKDGAPGKDGVDGSPGRDGIDGAPGEKGKDGVDGAPGADGRNGTDGAPGQKGLDGAPGLDGKDGLSLAGILKDHEGWLVFTLADGTMTRVAHVDGKDGRDGAPGRDAAPETLIAAVKDEVQKQVMAPLATAYKGVWKPEAYKNGDVVTCGGSLWLAKADTEAKPETNEAWSLIVKRGRDGRDGELKAPAEPKPVKLK